MKTVFLGSITNCLDSKRKPLNDQERSLIRGEGKYPYVGANNVLDHVDEYLFDEEILLLAEDGGSWGHREKCSFIMHEKCWVNNHAHVLTASENLHLKFLMYYLNYHDLNKYISGSTRGKLTKSALSRIKIPLPSLATQRKIAEALDKADAIRKRSQKILAKYDQLAQSVFLEMFGDPVLNEKGWEVKKIGNLVNVQGGFAFKSDTYSSEGIRLVKIANVHFENIVWDDVDFVPIEYLKKYESFSLKAGDILIALTRPIIKSLNTVKTAVVKNSDTPSLLNQRVARFNINEDQISKSFLLSFLYTDHFKAYVERLMPINLQPNISTGQIESMSIYLPPIDLQKQFATIIEQIEKQKAQTQAELDRAETLYQSLLQRAFTGDLFPEEIVELQNA